jgi:hypothetical protein
LQLRGHGPGALIAQAIVEGGVATGIGVPLDDDGPCGVLAGLRGQRFEGGADARREGSARGGKVDGQSGGGGGRGFILLW